FCRRATATPEISTLSLHDALPISPGVRLTTDIREAIQGAGVIMMLRVQLERQHEKPFPANQYFKYYGLRPEHLDLAQPDVIVMQDRKSTRLNSSHVKISYAVFCLK